MLAYLSSILLVLNQLGNANGGNQVLDRFTLALKQDDSRTLLSLMAEPGFQSLTGDTGITALHLSAHQGNADVSRILIRLGADVNAHVGLAPTPLIMALTSKKKTDNLIAMLLENKADPNMPYSGLLPIMFAVKRSEKTIELLLRHGASVDGTSSNLIVLQTIPYGSPGASLKTELLLNAGAPPNASEDLQPLTLAMRAKDYDSVKVLLNHGAMPMISPNFSRDKNSPLKIFVSERSSWRLQDFKKMLNLFLGAMDNEKLVSTTCSIRSLIVASSIERTSQFDKDILEWLSHFERRSQGGIAISAAVD